MTRLITEEPMSWEGWTLDSLSQTDGQAIPRDSSTDLTPGVGQLFLEKAR